MLKIVQSVHYDKLMGVIDDEANRIIVPVRYKNIQMQNEGIVAQQIDNDSFCTAFSITGELIYQNCRSVLFLKNGLLLITDANGLVYIYNYYTRCFMVEYQLEAVLVFIGNLPQATLFNGQNVAQLLSHPEYQASGAYLEPLVCARYNGNWGVINLENGSIYANFIYKVMVHCTNRVIGAVDFNGNQYTL